RVVPLLLGSFVMLSLGFSTIWIQPAWASLSSWTSTTSYPTNIAGQSCMVSSGFVYCIGGVSPSVSGPVASSAIYSAPLAPTGGVGPWSATTSYPTNIAFQSCVLDTGFVYCIGGATSGPVGCCGFTDAVYSA